MTSCFVMGCHVVWVEGSTFHYNEGFEKYLEKIVKSTHGDFNCDLLLFFYFVDGELPFPLHYFCHSAQPHKRFLEAKFKSSKPTHHIFWNTNQDIVVQQAARLQRWPSIASWMLASLTARSSRIHVLAVKVSTLKLTKNQAISKHWLKSCWH